MNVRSILVVAVVAAVAIPSLAAPVDLERLVPADATAVLLVQDVPELRAAWRTSALAEMWEDPAINAFFAPLRDRLEDSEWRQELRAEIGADPEELADMFTGGAVLFVAGLGDDLAELAASEEGGAGEWMPTVVVAAEVGDNGPELETLILRKIEEKAEEDPDRLTEHDRREFRGVTLHIERDLSGEEPVEGFSWAVFDGLLTVTTGPEPLERFVVDVQEDGPDEPLVAATSYSSVRKQTSDADLYLFIDFADVLPPLQKAFVEQLGADPEARANMPFEPGALVDALGLDGLRAAVTAARFENGGLLVDAGITFDEQRGLLGILAYGPEEAPRPGFIPADATTFGASRFDFERAWIAIRDVVNAVNPSLLAMANAQLTAMLQNADVELDLKRDVLEALGTEMVVVQGVPERTTPGAAPLLLEQNQVIGVSLDDRQGFSTALESLKAMAGGGSELFETREYLETTIHRLKIPQEEAGPASAQAEVAYAIANDWFLLSLGGPEVLESMLVTMQREGESAWDRPEVKRALARLPAGAVAVQYQDLGATGHALFETLAAVAAMSEGEAMIDPSAIPDAEAVSRHISSMVSGTYVEKGLLMGRIEVLPAAGREPAEDRE